MTIIFWSNIKINIFRKQISSIYLQPQSIAKNKMSMSDSSRIYILKICSSQIEFSQLKGNSRNSLIFYATIIRDKNRSLKFLECSGNKLYNLCFRIKIIHIFRITKYSTMGTVERRKFSEIKRKYSRQYLCHPRMPNE